MLAARFGFTFLFGELKVVSKKKNKKGKMEKGIKKEIETVVDVIGIVRFIISATQYIIIKCYNLGMLKISFLDRFL